MIEFNGKSYQPRAVTDLTFGDLDRIATQLERGSDVANFTHALRAVIAIVCPKAFSDSLKWSANDVQKFFGLALLPLGEALPGLGSLIEHRLGPTLIAISKNLVGADVG